MTPSVCSTSHLFHYFLNPGQDSLASFLSNGIRPLSDFPDSERWQQMQASRPDFYPDLYQMMAAPILKKPYPNSGIFITPLDFHRLPDSLLYNKPRFRLPLARIDPAWAVLTYIYEEERLVFPFSAAALAETAARWDAALVRRWFAVDRTKLFFYVPQVAVYQGHIPVTEADYEAPPAG